MKGWIKGMLIGAAVCVTAGTAVCGAAWAMGGRFSHYRSRQYGITVRPDDRTVRADTGEGEPPAEEPPEPGRTEGYPKDHHEAVSEAEAMGQTEKGFKGQLSVNGYEIRELEIKVAGAYVEVIPDEMADTIIITGDDQVYRYDQEVDDDTFKVSVRPRRNGNQGIWDLNEFTGPGVEIRIPAGFEFREVELEVNGGALLVHEIITGTLEMDLKAGLLEVAGGSAREVSGDCKAGELIYRGKAELEVEADCSAGVITYELEGKEEDFYYELDKEMGSIIISGTERGQHNKDTVIDNPGAVKKAELDCKLGEINVSFR